MINLFKPSQVGAAGARHAGVGAGEAVVGAVEFRPVGQGPEGFAHGTDGTGNPGAVLGLQFGAEAAAGVVGPADGLKTVVGVWGFGH